VLSMLKPYTGGAGGLPPAVNVPFSLL
jgi:hypothetical protein